MASSRIALSVPKELAINTNHPNASSVVIDLAAQEEGHPLRRSSRQPKPIGGILAKSVVKRKADIDVGEHRDCLTATTARPAKILKRSSESAGRNVQPALNVRSSSGDGMERSSRTTKSSSPSTGSQSTSSSLTSSIASSPTKSKDRDSISPAAETSRTLVNFQSESVNKPNNKRRKSNDSDGKAAKKVKPSSDNTHLERPPPPSPLDDCTLLHRSNSSNTGPTTRNAAPRKTPKRLALEAHMLAHDSYGAVRLHEGDAIAPYNAEQHLENIKAMFDNEPLMQRIQEMYDERMRKQESQRRLQELSRRMPWVATRFTRYEEYEEWAKRQLNCGIQIDESPSTITTQTNALQEDEGCTGQTTDEELCEEDEVSVDFRIAEMDAANILLRIFDKETSSSSGLLVEQGRDVPAQTPKATTCYMSAGPRMSTVKRHSQAMRSKRS